MENFDISPAYISDVRVERPCALPWGGFGTLISHVDHPQFAKLRNKLAKLGHIDKAEGRVNGDVVLKSFTLNRKLLFLQFHKFGSAPAVRSKLDFLE